MPVFRHTLDWAVREQSDLPEGDRDAALLRLQSGCAHGAAAGGESPGPGLECTYEEGSGILRVACAACGKFVADVAVARRETWP